MAAHAARRLMRMNSNLNVILGIELVCAVQGVEFREPLKTSLPLQKVITTMRETVAPLAEDRYMANDLEVAASMIADGELLTGFDLPEYILGQTK